jgi:transposase
MTDGTTRRYNEDEVLSGVQRRRLWPPEKVRIVEETYLPSMSVSLVGRRHRISGSQIFRWRRLMARGALTAATADEEVVPASEYRALEAQVRELQRLLGKKVMENELLREAVTQAANQKKLLLRSTSLPRGGLCTRLQRISASAARICPRCATDRFRDRVDDRRCRMPSWLPKSARSSPSCRPTGTVACTSCCAGKPRRPGAQRPIQSASTAS